MDYLDSVIDGCAAEVEESGTYNGFDYSIVAVAIGLAGSDQYLELLYPLARQGDTVYAFPAEPTRIEARDSMLKALRRPMPEISNSDVTVINL